MAPAADAAAGHARAYHDATKHSSQSVRVDRHFLDWETRPLPFKVYPDAPVVALPREIPPPELPALEALARVTATADRGGLDLAGLAGLLFFSAGLTRKKVYPGGETIHFRAAASTGALYEVEVYLVAGEVDGLAPGVYHFCPGDFALRRLRAGDHRGLLADAASEPARVREAPVTLVLSAIYWRNAWKYQARAYRHFFWDSGTLAANLLATAVALEVPARVLLGFADTAVNGLLGLDPAREGSLALVPLGAPAGAARPAPATRPIAPLDLPTVPLSSREVDYPLVRAAYAASSLPDGAAARAWAEEGRRTAISAPAGPSVAGLTLGETILRRGSTRQFAREAIARADLTTILDVALRDLPLDAGDPAAPLVETYLLVHAIDGLEAGAYVHEPHGLRLLRSGGLRQVGGHLCLDQPLGADASAVAFFLADLRPVLARYGSRGYRAVNFAAGLLGGRLYLAAYALGLGATGLTFYDDEVVDTFSPEAAGRDAIFVVALGRAAGRGRAEGLGQIAGRLASLRPGEA